MRYLDLVAVALAAAMVAGGPAVARQGTPVLQPEPAPGSMGPPPVIAVPTPDDDSKSWCRGPDGNLAECRATNLVIEGDSYPERALDNDVEGLAVIWCTILDPQGHLSCVPEAEAPTGYGFGAAAVKTIARNSQLVSTHGYDLTGYAHSVMVPFVMKKAPPFVWRDFASADGLAALFTAGDRARLPPVGPDGFELSAAEVEISCVQADDAHHAQCQSVRENDPALGLGDPVAKLVSAEARLRSPDGAAVSTVVSFPFERPHLVTPITADDIAVAAKTATRHGKGPRKAPANAAVKLRCVVKDADGDLGCTVAWEEFPDYGFGEPIRALLESRGRATVGAGWPLQGRVMRYDILVPVG